MAIGDVIARLSVSLGMETAAFEKGAKQASGQVSKLQGAMSKAATFIGGAFAASAVVDGINKFREATRAATDAVGGLGEAAQQVGVTTDALQEYRYIATQVGVSNDEMDQGLSQLTKRLGEAAQGSKAPTDALKLLGLSLDDIKGKNAGDVIPLIADGLSRIKDPAEQAAIVVDLFGKAGQKLLPLLTEGSAGIEKMIAAAKEMGLVLTPEEIANADKYGDAMAALDAKVNAQLANKLAANADAMLQFEQAIADFKIGLIDAVVEVQGWGKALDSSAQTAHEWGLSVKHAALDGLHSFADTINEAMRRNHDNIARFFSLGKDMVLGLARGIRNSASEVWNALKGVVTSGITNAKALLRIKSPSRVFMEIGAYIGDGLAIGIEGGKGKVAAATQKLTEAARKAAEEVRALMAELFPEIGEARDYQAKRLMIEGDKKLSPDAKAEALYRLGVKTAGMDRTGSVPLSDDVMNQGSLITGALAEVNDKLDVFGKKAGSVTVNVAKSFKDMADATVASLQTLANSIKGGGFLDILSAVVGLGLQLGSIGVFGKGVAGRINAPKIPGNANGTANWRGGLTMVGERGPELVNLPRGSRVWPNGQGPGMAQKLQVEVVANNNGFGAIVRNHAGQVVAEAAPSLMQGASQVAQSQIAYRQTRRVA